MSNKIKKTLLLDIETVEILTEYGQMMSGSENISAAVRSLARQFKKYNIDKNAKKVEF